ncbi:MAG: hypothetical protein A2Y12_07200 [Planctomycetes bacterium GWF2_42_9]|nr:MAG: hypothetical protein A2Y12_07200 [Planctomycetes bacterium GWF2_42_9]HAL45570.1 hypothetical protein [Phycisphaerales bacterium]
MNVEVELSRIIIDEASDQQVIVLKEKNGARCLPIIIGIVEIMAIERKLKNMSTIRPLTHDLLKNVIKSLGANIEKVVVRDIKNHTYYATIYLNVDGRKIEVDSRPSDAIALAASSTIPLYVADHVFGGE